MAHLGDHVEALEAVGLYVHAGTLRRRVGVAGHAGVALPIAVLTIARSALPLRQVLVPTRIALDQETPQLH